MERIKISSGGNCDFISRLPDPILHQILGLLKIEEAVQTCVLSKRWEHLWTSLSSLNFHCDYDNSEAYGGDEWFVKNEAIYGRFATFVNSLLMRRQSLDLDVFRLFCNKLWSGYEREWVRYAVNHNPRVLDLALTRSLPWCVYTCSSLEELYLTGIYPSDLIVNLPKLRKLTICLADLNSICVKNLLSGCPILEFLQLELCIVRDSVIAHEFLKHLAIINCDIIHEEHHLFINAPCLLSFLYESDVPLPYKTTLNMPSLTSSCLASFADISLEEMATCLHFLTNIELLKLHFKCALDMELSSADLPLELPIFPKLKNVTIVFSMFSCFQMVTWILKSSPNLTKLTILQQEEECLSHSEEDEDEDEDEGSAPSTIVVSPCKKFVIVEVIYRRYNKMVRQVVDSLMDGREEFKNLKIHCRSTRVVNNI
ncbi:FBD-associated F-box protein At5g60610-like [Carex rostrata]